MHKILLTGGAGFIGSNLAKTLLDDDRVSLVRVLDNFSTGYKQNLTELLNHPKFELIEGDITSYETCIGAMKNIDLVSHQAALGSVPRSIENPILTNQTNINGTLNVFCAAKEIGVKKIVFAASSSTYGDSETLPKIEHIIGRPLSKTIKNPAIIKIGNNNAIRINENKMSKSCPVSLEQFFRIQIYPKLLIQFQT